MRIASSSTTVAAQHNPSLRSEVVGFFMVMCGLVWGLRGGGLEQRLSGSDAIPVVGGVLVVGVDV